ncbi:MAG: metal-dependent transcriptional regulator [Saprospiraceae bacterium]|nr:metal-dependent transcriptional regulator [Saprospiraceae bacterium]
MLTFTEENYLKALFQLSAEKGIDQVGTTELAQHLNLKPASINDMLKKLKEKNFVETERYSKITLTDEGKRRGAEIMRRNRIWETFLYDKLDFTWDEVQEVAEQLEHVSSKKLIDKLYDLLESPEFDPHGNPIPDLNGNLKVQFRKTLAEVETGQSCKMVAVKESSNSFLQCVMNLGLVLNNKITVVRRQEFDDLLDIEINGRIHTVSQKLAQNIYVLCLNCQKESTCIKHLCNLN